MKGYATAEGYMGLVQGRYMLFASEVVPWTLSIVN